MNTHPFANEDVMAYLDGELSPSKAAEMTAHLAQCRTCQDVAADLQGVSRQISGWTVELPVTEDVPDQIVTALKESAAEKTLQHQHVHPWRFVLNHPWAVVAASVVFSISLLFWISQEARQARVVHQNRVLAVNESASAPLPVSATQTQPPADSKHEYVVGQFFATTTNAPLLVVRTAELRVTAHSFDALRTDLDRILGQFGGHIAQLNIASPTGEARSLTAALRIPASQLEPALGELRKLGHVDGESQSGEEVTQQSVDLDARLNNARHTEQRLTQILATRTGKLSEVLEVEQKLAEVRGQIEQAEAEQKSLNNRISLATVSLQVSEDYRAPLT